MRNRILAPWTDLFCLETHRVAYGTPLFGDCHTFTLGIGKFDHSCSSVLPPLNQTEQAWKVRLFEQRS